MTLSTSANVGYRRASPEVARHLMVAGVVLSLFFAPLITLVLTASGAAAADLICIADGKNPSPKPGASACHIGIPDIFKYRNVIMSGRLIDGINIVFDLPAIPVPVPVTEAQAQTVPP